jgi:VirE N-terminal domain
MIPPADIPARVSFGLNVRRPDILRTRTTGDILSGIQSGEWQEAVIGVRSLPPDSKEQNAAKLALPYATWAGVFERRENSRLVEHSGQVGIDLDNLGQAGAVEVLQTAVTDVFCLAAFRSIRGEGVRLIFRIPGCTPKNHSLAFEQVAEHVRTTYGRDADESGKDVSRPSFVSFDRGLWVNPSAAVLPLRLPDDTQRLPVSYRCVSSPYVGKLASPCWGWYGRHYANILPVSGDTGKTHQSLLQMGMAVALHGERIREPVTSRVIDSVFDSWWKEHQKQGNQLRCQPEEYREELRQSIEGAKKKSWFKSAAEKWIRWKNHKDFPSSGSAEDKILFAVRQHCAEHNTAEFFIGARDAGLVAGVSFCTAARALRKLCGDGRLEKVGERTMPRHAQNYLLKNQDAMSCPKNRQP